VCVGERFFGVPLVYNSQKSLYIISIYLSGAQAQTFVLEFYELSIIIRA